jgi:ribosome maturation factor RimP
LSDIADSLEKMALGVVEAEGFILYDVDFIEKQRKLVVTIDKPGGVSIDDCALVSRALNLLLDVENVIPGENPYDLEVSSPGLERDLKKLWHYESALEKPVKVVIKKGEEQESFGNLRSFKAYVDKVENGIIYFKDVESSKLKNIAVPFEVIHKAHIVFEYGRQKKY